MLVYQRVTPSFFRGVFVKTTHQIHQFLSDFQSRRSMPEPLAMRNHRGPGTTEAKAAGAHGKNHEKLELWRRKSRRFSSRMDGIFHGKWLLIFLDCIL